VEFAALRIRLHKRGAILGHFVLYSSGVKFELISLFGKCKLMLTA